jgi:hypothetical protein
MECIHCKSKLQQLDSRHVHHEVVLHARVNVAVRLCLRSSSAYGSKTAAVYSEIAFIYDIVALLGYYRIVAIIVLFWIEYNA